MSSWRSRAVSWDRRRLLVDIAMNYFCRVPAFFQRFLDLFRQHHGSMLSTCASKRNGQITFTFLDVVRHQVGQQALHATQKFSGLWKGANKAAHLGGTAGEAT